MDSARVIRLAEPDEAFEEEARTAARIAVAIRNGDEPAKAELYDRYGPGLFRIVLRKIRDRDQAACIIQETFRIALEKLSSDDLEYPERLAGYLRGISRHRVSAYFRQQKREPVGVDPEVINAIQDVRPLQYEAVSREQTNTAIHKLLDSLPMERDRELLVRLYIYDQDRVEIREALSMSPHQLDVALSRARARFKKIVMESEIATDVMSGRETGL